MSPCSPWRSAQPRDHATKGCHHHRVEDAERMLSGLLGAARLSVPDDLPELLTESGRALGADHVTIFLVDPEQYVLVALTEAEGTSQTVPVDGTLPGRSFREVTLEQRSDDVERTV